MTPDQSSIPALGSLVVPFPPGWTFEYQDQCPVEGRGPNNEFASISFGEKSPGANEGELRNHFELRASLMSEMVLAVAADTGTPHGELSVLLEMDGRTIYSMASRTESSGVEGYFLQYVCESLVSQHYINIRGRGAIDEAMATWDGIMRRSTWAHEA